MTPPDNGTLLEVAGLSVEIDVPAGVLHAVSDIDFSVARGETLAIVGESGCGKTMTALAIMRLLPRKARIRARRIALEGQDVTALPDRAFSEIRGARMSMIFQDPMTALNPVYKISDQLEEAYLRHRGGPRRAAGSGPCPRRRPGR